MLYYSTTVIFEVYLQCFIETASLRDIGKTASRAEISSHNSLYFKAVKIAQLGSALLFFNNIIQLFSSIKILESLNDHTR